LNLYDKTAHELHDMLINKQVTSVEITKSVIERADKTEQILNCYLERTNEDALKTAKKVDEKIAKGKNISPLEGLPCAIKDNICTDGVKTTCASKMLENFVPFYDAYVVSKIKDENSPILGKLNMDEFAMGSSTENSYFKTTKNPYNTACSPGGSSGGSAAAVSAGSAVFSLGSDSGGSLRQPASFCGIVGIKPTYGLVSRFGCVGFASSLDQIGPLTKDVRDGALALNAIAGYDANDSTSANMEKADYTAALTKGVAGMKIAVISDYMQEGINEQVKKAVLAAVEVLSSLGAELSECAIPSAKYALAAYHIISAAEVSSNLARFDGVRYGYRSGSYNDITEMLENTRAEGFGDEVKRRIIAGTFALSAKNFKNYFEKAQKVRTVIRNDFDKALGQADILIAPTSMTTAFALGEKNDNPTKMHESDFCTCGVNMAGLPALSLPCGFDKDGLPIGLQIIGKAFDESKLLTAAYAFEQSADFHKMRAIIKNEAGEDI